jgi:hypothetical protein
MRTADPFEPEVEAALEAIDATLAGDPVDPDHAELAELALILRGDRPTVGDPFATAMDARVHDRFAKSGPRGARPSRRPLRGWIVWAPAGALAAVALVVVLVTLVPGGGGSSSSSDVHAVKAAAGSGVVSSSSASAPSSAGAGSAASSSSAGAAAGGFSAGGSGTTTSGSGTAPPPTAPSGGHRQVVQSARLALSTRPGRINAVSQRVFRVVGRESGYVAHSSVTVDGSPQSRARMELSVPSANLRRTLIALTQVPGATVVSSTSASQDITAQVGGAGRRLAEARALLRSLLTRLATADTTEQIDSLKAQIRDANVTIDRDQAALTGLHRRVQYSRIALTIQGSAPAESGGHDGSGSGFTLHRAGHDAVRVLVVAAGVLLIALAVAIPLSLVGALLAWLWLRLRRHRRESALERA